ncbi:ERAD-associated E3 ubiquitin-protein ligase HRD1-like [Coccinella septempunctata]|uniref:ERAD-associated E3 ubiquitin-protein ligase HRD1-like n=1 Tax=Coccinella septempunctata TaxID=41139 RepID=UPI001D088909|nr:ERAD-associated E3 ubiquitin-protein ligase HRD1-like [Coccinella septempunctata]
MIPLIFNYSRFSVHPPQTWNQLVALHLFRMIIRLFEEIHFMEQFFIKMHHIFAFTCQVIFFILCDFFLNDILGTTGVKTNKTVVMALTTILFYAVFGYFATRIRDIFLKSRIPTSFGTPSNCVKLLLRLVLEWAKTAIIILCIREQGIQYSPHPIYTMLTLSYYLSSEKVFCEILSALAENVYTFEYFENLEYLYIPMYLNIFSIALGILVNLYLLLFCYSNFVLMTTYFIIFLRIKDVFCNYWQMIVAEKKTYSSFRVATDQEINDRDDICAVCLNKMSKARITPCNHLFHPICLKQCLKNSFLCPLCKYNFREEV